VSAGLQLGADDYLPKPFAMQELVARVSRLGPPFLPKNRGSTCALAISLSIWRIMKCIAGARRIELSARELMLLKVLMREPGRVFTRTELCERVWEHAHEYDTKLVEVFIGRFTKKKIGDPLLIHTVSSRRLHHSRTDRSLRHSAQVTTAFTFSGTALVAIRCDFYCREADDFRHATTPRFLKQNRTPKQLVRKETPMNNVESQLQPQDANLSPPPTHSPAAIFFFAAWDWVLSRSLPEPHC